MENNLVSTNAWTCLLLNINVSGTEIDKILQLHVFEITTY